MCYSEQEKALKAKQIQNEAPAPRTVEETRTADEPLVQNGQQVRRARIWNVAEQMNVQMPRMSISEQGDISVQGEKYARKSKESISATKRKMYRNISYSALYKSEARARQVEAAESGWLESRARIRKEHPQILEGRSALEADIITQFWSDNEAQNKELLGENMKKECLAQFMELDLELDLRTDQAFADQCPKMEEILRKSEAFLALFMHNPDFVSELPGDQTEAVVGKMKKVKAFTNYYQIRKKVMTNAYYRSHYHSEISYRYHESDTKEQKNLTLLLWQMESVKNQEWLPNEDALRIRQQNQMRDFRETVGVSQEEVRDTQEAKAALQMDTPFKIGQNAQEMRQEEDRLRQGSQHIREGVERLSSPEAEDPELMRAMKENLEKQMNYLERKYGNGLPLLSPKELGDHREEILRDFTDLEQYGKLIGILRGKGKAFFDPDRAEDKKLERLHSYYSRWLHTERRAREDFARGGMTYSDYKRKAAIDAVYKNVSATWITLGQKVEDMIAASDAMKLDVDWETVFDEQNVSFQDILLTFDQKDLMEKGVGLQNALSRQFEWQMLFPETRDMGSDAAARYFVEKEARGYVEEHRQQWRSMAFSVEGFVGQGLGTPEFLKMNEHYREILEQEGLGARYGLTRQEDMEEYRSIMQRTQDMAEELHKAEYYNEKAAELREQLRGRLGGAVVRQTKAQKNVPDVRGFSYRTLENSLRKTEDRYADRVGEIRRKSLNPLYQEFLEFQERAGMWNTPENKTLADAVLEPEVKSIEPEIAVTLAGETFQIYESPLSEMLQKESPGDGGPSEELRREIERYNDSYIRDQVCFRILKEAKQKGEQPEGSLWQRLRDAGMKEEGYMIYDLSSRHSVYTERMKQSLTRIQGLLK